MKFEIKTVEVADNAVQTRIFIDGVDVTNRIKKFTLKKDGSPLELSLTILGDIDVSVDNLEMSDIKSIDSIQSEYQYAAREKIINRRKEKGLTSKRVSELIGITQGGYSHVESGSRNLTVPVAKRLAKVLDMHWTEFFED